MHNSDGFFDELLEEQDLETFGKMCADFFSKRGFSLIYFSIFHSKDELEPLHIYVDVTPSILEMCAEFQEKNGCPLAREAIKICSPFEALRHDYSDYEDALSRRYLSEFMSLEYEDILVIPIKVGKGVALFVFGHSGDESNEHYTLLLLPIVAQILSILNASFPFVARYFEPKKLTRREAQCLLLSANGLVESKIAEKMKVSAHTVRMHIENSKRKMGARNKPHAVAIAISTGEISSGDLQKIEV